MRKNETLSTLKEALSLSSKLFTAFTIMGLIIAFFRGNLDISHQEVFSNIVTIFVCIIAVFMFKKLKIAVWLNYVISYVVIISVLLGFMWLQGILFYDFIPDYLGGLLRQSLIFIAITLAGGVGEYFRRKKTDAEQDG